MPNETIPKMIPRPGDEDSFLMKLETPNGPVSVHVWGPWGKMLNTASESVLKQVEKEVRQVFKINKPFRFTTSPIM